MITDLSSWLTEPEAAARLGVSERTLRTWAGQGKRPERKYRARPDNRSQPVYNPRDVEDLEAERASKPMVLPADVEQRFAKGQAEMAMAAAPSSLALLVPFVERLTVALERRLAPPEPILPWVTMAEAALVTGLSENLLRRLVRGGKLGCFRDRQGWKVRRSDLEGLEASKLHQVTAELRQNLNHRKAAGR